MKLGTRDVENMMLGTKQIEKVYKGNQVVWEQELPSGYTKLEYLESTGTQYINTGIVPDSNTGFKVKLSVAQITQDSYLFGARQGASDTRFIIGAYNGYIYLGYGQTYSDSDNWRPQINEVFEISNNYNNDKMGYYNNSYPKEAKQSTIPSLGTTTIGIFISLGYSTRITSQKVYYVKITQNGTITNHFIPCLDNNNVPCMYDKVTKTTFYNAGSGNFLYG